MENDMTNLNLTLAAEAFLGSDEGAALVKAGHRYGATVKKARQNHAPAIAAERINGMTVTALADAYGMSRGSITNYGMVGTLVLAQPDVDRGVAYTYVTQTEGVTSEMVETAAETVLTSGGDVLEILAEMVANIGSDEDDKDGDKGKKDDEDKTAKYVKQALDALANLAEKGKPSEADVQAIAAALATVAGKVSVPAAA